MYNRFLILLILILLVLAFAFQGTRGIYSPDEGYYVSIAQAMVETGDYLIPRLHHEPWLDKPPLSLWGIAAGLKLFGQNEWGARVFHGLCFILTVLLVFLLGKSLSGKREAFLGSVIYATMVIPFAAGNAVTPDTPLALLTTISFLCFWKSVEPGGRNQNLWKMLMCVAFGIGFLTKGPAVLIPSGAMFLFLVIQQRAFKYFWTPWAVLGLVLFSICGLSWYAYVACNLPGALNYFLDNQLLGRTVSAKYGRNPGLKGALIYIPVILLGTLPWSYYWLGALKSNVRKMFRKRTWCELRNDPARLFLALWVSVPLTVLSLASSKLPLYALPIFPALALATARLFSENTGRSWRNNPLGFSRKAILALGLWAFILIGIKYCAAIYPSKKDMRALHVAIEKHLPTGPYEIVSVRNHLEGLGFYSEVTVERVTTRETPYPFFVLPEPLYEEIAELGTTDYAHLFICHKEKRAKKVRRALYESGIQFQETALPFRRFLFTVDAMQMKKDIVRLVALGDAGKNEGGLRGVSLGNVLRRHYGEKNYSDGILLLGDNLHYGPEDAGDPAAVARREIEIPFKSIIDLNVPFYAALGNHDVDHDLKAFELQYPLFNMKGQRYYSKVFGNGLVEVFFLDSNTLEDEDIDPDPQQIKWLKGALRQSSAIWKVAVLHHPIYSTAMKHPADPVMARLLDPLFREYGVSLVLQGHNHVYERLTPMHGIHYITAGSGGIVRKGDLRPDAQERLAGNDQVQVFLMLEFNSKTCKMIAYDMLLKVVDECSIAL
jgi:4-amino-4-deoxy-L-arabinose transferase-like glycosyltransferase